MLEGLSAGVWRLASPQYLVDRHIWWRVLGLGSRIVGSFEVESIDIAGGLK